MGVITGYSYIIYIALKVFPIPSGVGGFAESETENFWGAWHYDFWGPVGCGACDVCVCVCGSVVLWFCGSVCLCICERVVVNGIMVRCALAVIHAHLYTQNEV